MSILTLTPAQLGLSPAIPADGDYPMDSVLHGQLAIAGCQYHVTAIQVAEGVGGDWRPIHQEYISEVNALYDLSGTDLTTSTINGKEYLLAIFSHGS